MVLKSPETLLHFYVPFTTNTFNIRIQSPSSEHMDHRLALKTRLVFTFFVLSLKLNWTSVFR